MTRSLFWSWIRYTTAVITLLVVHRVLGEIQASGLTWDNAGTVFGGLTSLVISYFAIKDVFMAWMDDYFEVDEDQDRDE